MDLQELWRRLDGAQFRNAGQQMPRSITGITYNSKTTKKGELFFCLRGTKSDGHAFAAEAVQGGASALVVEEFLPLDVPQIKVPDSRAALAEAARWYFGDPAKRLGLVGVTGTNGKTTTAFLIRSIFEQAGRKTGMIGTVYNLLGGEPQPSAMTTPESLDLTAMLAEAVQNGCRWVVMEVSSHALAMGRVDPAEIHIAVVTNITRDHFEFHGTFEHYWASKARLVRELGAAPDPHQPSAAVLNADDEAVMAMAKGAETPVLTFGLTHPADVTASQVETGVTGCRFLLHTPGATPTPVRLRLPGTFNVNNALAAAAAARAAGIDLGRIVSGLEACRHVPGRAEVIEEGQDFHVIVDFAHNPDALRKIVSLRPDKPGARTIIVFGAEGGKDQGKRPQMGEAARGADYAIVTSDNVPKEEPEAVASQVAAGLGGHPHEIILDRRTAIARALEMARPGDLVIIAGKGHEQTWVVGNQRIAFDDRAVVRELLKAIRNQTEV